MLNRNRNKVPQPTKYGRRTTLWSSAGAEAGQMRLFQSDLIKGPTVVAWGHQLLCTMFCACGGRACWKFLTLLTQEILMRQSVKMLH